MYFVVLAPELEIPSGWAETIEKAVPGVKIAMEHSADNEAVFGAIVDAPQPGKLQGFSNLKIVLSLSAGVDTLLADPLLPKVPIVRVINSDIAALMTEYVVYQVLRIHRGFAKIERLQHEKKWVWWPGAEPAASRKLLVMGMGHVGRSSARALCELGFQVYGWSTELTTLTGVQSLVGQKMLNDVLPTIDIVICLLPLSKATRGLLDERFFNQLPAGACVINAGRGQCLNESDLIAALDKGQLEHATLDVFAMEPLPPENPLWLHPKVTITPHTAAYPTPCSYIQPLIRILEKLRSGRALDNVVDRNHGY